MQPELAERLRERTRRFSVRILNLYQVLSAKPAGRIIGNQLLRSGTAIGANYRAACRSRSAGEFAARIAVALEEADETAYWLELLVETALISPGRLSDLARECEEFIRIFSAARHTTRQRFGNQNSKFKNQN
jgi:four helix bundle protein